MVSWNKELIGKVLSVVLTMVIALLSVFGYSVVVVQPQLSALQAQVAAFEAPSLVQILGDSAAASPPGCFRVCPQDCCAGVQGPGE